MKLNTFKFEESARPRAAPFGTKAYLTPQKLRLLLLFFVALIIRLTAIIFWQFDGLYGQDPYAYYQQAIAIAQNLPQGQPPPTDFFWPNGYPLVIALLMPIVGQTALAGQLAALLCGALLSPLMYLLTRDLFFHSDTSLPPSQLHRAGLLAGLVVAAAGQPILSSIVIMADMPALFWATLSAWLVVRAIPHPNPLPLGEGTSASLPLGGNEGGLIVKRHKTSPAPPPPRSAALHFLAAGATLALAIITRWIYVLIVPALVLYAVFSLRHRKALWWTPLPAVLSGVGILIPQLWLSFNRQGSLLHSWLLGWQPANFFQRHFENIDGQFDYLLPVGLFYAQPAGHPAYIFPLLGLASLWGLWRLGQSRQWQPLILLLGWIAPVYLFLGGIPYQNFRFGLTLYLPFVILTGYGLSGLLSIKMSQLRAISFVIVLLSFVGMLGWAYPMLNNFLTTQNHSKTIAHQVEQALPAEATVLTFGLTLTVQHYTQLNTLELFHLDEDALDDLIKTENKLYLLLDVRNVETQWQGRTPQRNYHWLKSHMTLTEIETFPPYTLFKIETQKSNGGEN